MLGKVKTRVNQDGDYTLEVSVIDEGIGMTKDEANHVFTTSFKTKNPESKSLNPYGNGIGLSFCKQIC